MSKMEKVEAWGSAIGESLIAGDLAALIAHKRASVMQQGSSQHSRSASRGGGQSESQLQRFAQSCNL